jgi:DNA-binding response OmpR family regulator
MALIDKAGSVLAVETDAGRFSTTILRLAPKVCLLELPDLGDALLDQICICAQLMDPTPPVIVMCSTNTLERERSIRMHGVFYYLVRPFADTELIEAVDAALEQQEDPTSISGTLHNNHSIRRSVS